MSQSIRISFYRVMTSSVTYSTSRPHFCLTQRTRQAFICLFSNSSPTTFASATQFLPKQGLVNYVSLSWSPCSKGLRNRFSFLIKSMSSSTSGSSVQEHMTPENTVEEISLLTGVKDLYGGVIIELKDPLDPKIFIPLLRASLSQWRQQGKKGVWIKIPIELVNLVEPTVQEGFRYHHAEQNYLMLVYWIPETPDTIPVNASHQVGIGAFVVNDNREVLVVQENSGVFKGTGIWKLPTGVVNEGEHICTAAIREVKEETGIDAEFVEILAFRQNHQSFFSKSDLFFVCMLRACSFDIEKQENEVAEAKWMPIEEYVNQPYNQKHLLFKSVAEICRTKADREYTGFSAVPLATASGKETYLYFNNKNFNPL